MDMNMEAGDVVPPPPLHPEDDEGPQDNDNDNNDNDNNDDEEENDNENENNEEEDEDMDEEDEVDEEDDDDEEEEAPDDDVLDGGVAEPQEEGAAVRSASQADITLFLKCSENMDLVPNHPILRPGTSVQIGLDKNTKLSAVFARYVLFCNQHGASPENLYQNISVDDLEFVHCQLLKGHDTTEAAALMKNDHITVRKEQSSDRDLDQEHQRMQREADREYFYQLRQLVPGGTLPSKLCNVVLDCRGSLADNTGRIQQVLSTTVRCHSAVVRKRCPWLGRMIDAASREQARRSIVSLPDADIAPALAAAALEQDQHQLLPAMPDRHVPVAESKDSEDDDIEVLNYNVLIGNRETRSKTGAAKIENDDDEPKPNVVGAAAAVADLTGDDDTVFPIVQPDTLWVTLSNHAPDAVKLMLEFVYTNRVVSLGCIAFLQSCKSKPDRKHQGPVPPFSIGNSASRPWPNRGEPTVSFPVVIACLALAEEASLPRLSLMCEIAAAQLVSATNVVEALATCQTQKELTGNSLSRLRKAAMDIVLRSGPRGVFVLPTFRRALEERGKALIPTLLAGTMEAVDSAEAKTKKGQGASEKRDWQEIALDYFGIVDREDANKRERERRKRRMERLENDPSRIDDHESGALKNERLMDALKPGSWATAAQRRSLKRMSHQMEQIQQIFPPQQARRSSKARRGSGLSLSKHT